MLRVNEIGEYIRHSGCARRFRLEINHRRLARRLPFHERLFNALDPVLQLEGRRREDAWAQTLADAGFLGDVTTAEDGVPWPAFKDFVASIEPGQNAFVRELQVEANVGAFPVTGRVDFALICWSDEKPTLRIVECKASRRDRTYHRIQVALYRRMLRSVLEGDRLQTGDGRRILGRDVEAVVARIDEATNAPQPILALEPLDLAMEEADLAQLLAPNGTLDVIASSDLDDLSYQLNQKCDGCVFNTDCLPESALHERVQLLGVPPTTVRALQRVGIESLEELRELDPHGDQSRQLQADPSFAESIPALLAKANARSSTLPGHRGDPELFDVEAIDNSGYGSLPQHERNGIRLVRVYLAVDYDYAENRLGAISAHVTTSEGHLHAPFEERPEGWRPFPGLREVLSDWSNRDAHPSELPEVNGMEVIKFKSSAWTGNYDQDSGAERELLEGFLHELVDAIDEVSDREEVPIHFYVWSPSEMSRLVEACSRVSSNLLSHLRHLLGCRESLEQLIYSAVGADVDRRYALGWTGRGLAVATSLMWYGRRYHWTRRVGRSEVALDRVFTQDIFDFKTTLAVENGQWASRGEGESHLFEIRSRFFDTLSAPYWRAMWDMLPNPEDVRDAQTRNMILRYRESARPNYLREYLRARVHGLRWIEERIISKNRDIAKPLLQIEELRQFELLGGVRSSCIDFLRLDQHIAATNWSSEHLATPATRVSTFKSLPVTNLQVRQDNTIVGDLEVDAYGITIESAAANSSFQEGSWVRLTPRPDVPHAGQNLGLLHRLGRTCVVGLLDWDNGRVMLEQAPMYRPDRYRLLSVDTALDADLFEHALIEESPSNYVSPHVDRRLSTHLGAHVDRWFDPTLPDIPEATPLDQHLLDLAAAFLEEVVLPDGNHLQDDQQQAILGGIAARVHLLQGPPGTGKTLTSAVAILLRIAVRLQPGDVVLVSGPTHTAVDTLLERIAAVRDAVEATMDQIGLGYPTVTVCKVHSGPVHDPSPAPIEDLVSDRNVRRYNDLRNQGVLMLGGLSTGLLKNARYLRERATFPTNQDGTFAKALFVDEGSMLLFPNFLATASIVEDDGEIIVAGDHRQLAPIIAHDWQREDRPPAVLYQPYVSAYEAVRRLAVSERVNEHQLALTALTYSFRLPPEIRELVSRIYARDAIELAGGHPNRAPGEVEGDSPFRHVWSQPTGLFLILHGENESRKSNATEAAIVEELLRCAPELPDNSVAVITPHRAQRSLLTQRLGAYQEAVGMVDTVERLQGDQRPTVIVSATASEPVSIASNVDFLLDLNRANVAFSRAQERLVVVCSRSLLEHIPPELEQYESAALWKSLREVCNEELQAFNFEGHDVSILMCPPRTQAEQIKDEDA